MQKIVLVFIKRKEKCTANTTINTATYCEDKSEYLALGAGEADSGPQAVEEVALLGRVHFESLNISHVQGQLTQGGQVRAHRPHQQHVTTGIQAWTQSVRVLLPSV